MMQQAGLPFNEMPTQLIAGVDEVGRGPLMGNVVAAAVILPEGFDLPLRDSKKLSEAKRLAFFEQIKTQALSYCIAEATPQEIDELNILQATLLAMKRAVEGLSVAPSRVLVDGNRCPNLSLPCQAIVKGDDLVLAISAASILAKVTRDAQMQALHQQYPEYGFANHKGYPTAQHLAALDKHGVLPGGLYRQSFKPVYQRLNIK